MELWETKVKTQARKDFPFKRTVIAPIGDVQLGNFGCAEDEFRKWIKRCISLDAWFVGMGDYIDLASPSERIRLVSSAKYDSTVEAFEETAQRHTERFLNLLKGTEGRWIGMLEGHHYTHFLDGTTTDTRICRALNTQFLGDCAMIRCVMNTTPNSPIDRTRAVTFWLHHGEGSGETIGSPVNKMTRVALGFDADVFMMAHYHRKGVFDLAPELSMATKPPYRLVARERKAILTGAWLRGYVEGSKQAGGSRAGGTYVEQKMLTPLPIGAPLVYLEPYEESRRSGNGRRGILVRGDA